MTIIQSRQALRQAIKAKRAALSQSEQHQASQQLLQQMQTLDEIKSAKSVALYHSLNGEIDTAPCIEWLWQQGIHVYLPVIHPFSAGHLLFLRYTADTQMCSNQYSIQEPKLDIRHVLPTYKLDIIFTPLVAFDENGERLGMGGGYYDRTLANWFSSQTGAKPIGLAHDCQRVDAIPCEAWDVPLPKIITPSKIWNWESKRLAL